MDLDGSDGLLCILVKASSWHCRQQKVKVQTLALNFQTALHYEKLPV
jgi:hypothetical protein